MLFYILCGLVAVIVIASTAFDGLYGFVTSLFSSAFVAGVIFGLTALIVAGVGGVHVPYKSETQHTLQAMGTKDRVNGSFFLGTGYVSGSSTINYIERAGDGGAQLKQVTASRSTIYEVDEDPTLITRHYSGSPWWLAPFDMYSVEAYEFRVPQGTVDNGYELSTK